MGDMETEGWSTDQYNPGVSTTKSPQKQAELAAVSAVYKLAVAEGRTEVEPPPLKPKAEPYGVLAFWDQMVNARRSAIGLGLGLGLTLGGVLSGFPPVAGVEARCASDPTVCLSGNPALVSLR
jgi:hypothetical protein